jgi:manganese/zinc/iron transport system permease protein
MSYSESLFEIAWTQVVSGLCLCLFGNHLFLRRTPLLSDALSHSVLPGLVAAFALSGTKATGWMILGGVVSVFLATFLVGLLQERKYFRKDVAVVVTYTSFFSLGVFLISFMGGRVDLDPDCVLFGDLSLLPFASRVVIGGWDLGPLPSLYLLVALVVSILFFVFLNRAMIWSLFDPIHYSVIGGHKNHFLQRVVLMLLSGVLVLNFEVMGSIAVLCNLLLPPVFSAAFAKTQKQFWGFSIGFSFVIQILGFWFSVSTDTLLSVGPGVVGITALIIFALIKIPVRLVKGSSA